VSIENCPVFGNALVNVVPVVESVHVAASGGDVRLTSSCFRHVNGVPFWLTCVFSAAVAFALPFTPSHPPYRLSKLWFSS
jgi:hypothetical protein